MSPKKHKKRGADKEGKGSEPSDKGAEPAQNEVAQSAEQPESAPDAEAQKNIGTEPIASSEPPKIISEPTKTIEEPAKNIAEPVKNIAEPAKSVSSSAKEKEPVGKLKGLYLALTSVPVLTIVCLILIDVWLRQGNPMDAIGIRNVDSWDVTPKILFARKVHPEVALIGSSLMLVLNQDEHGTHFYTGNDPSYLSDQLRKITGTSLQIVNLCTGLQMVSEAYFITEAACNTPRYPRVFIYGISLREFVQDAFAAEYSTESFHSVCPYVPLGRALHNVVTEEAERELVLSHFWYLYRNRNDFKNWFSAMAKDFLENFPLDRHFDRMGEDHEWHPQKTGYLFEQWIPRKQEKFAEQIYKTHPDWLRNYYKKFQVMMYRERKDRAPVVAGQYFKALNDLCKEKQIQLVVVNMPYSPDVMTVVPPELMEGFRTFLRQGRDAGWFTLIDLWGRPEFTDNDYKDGVHLNFEGSRKLADDIVKELQENYPYILKTMEKQAKEQEGIK